MYRYLKLKEEGPVARLTLDRPDRRNALSLDVMGEVIHALTNLPDNTQVVVLGGEGPAFSAGHDLAEMLDRDVGFYRGLFDVCTRMMETIHRIPQPVIARVHGPAYAAGCQLVASCDLAVASETATFATPGVKIGLFCSTPMVPISRAVGRKRAMEMLLTGEPIDAHTAARWGLVNRVVPPAALDEEIDRLVAQITRYSPLVIGIGKEAFYSQIELDEHRAYDLTKAVMASNARMADAQEGMGAFIDKREPRWPGR
ncbi:MAG: enoyl-CoA hydratase [Acidimicrobiia bacterium]|nr:MAG: enoyl-CoA hydratase [Acidimicrobiia bacterium]